MKTRWTTSLLLLLIASLAISACTGGGGDTGGGQSAANEAEGTESGAVTLPIFASPPAQIIDLSTNVLTKHIEDRLNIKFQFEIAPPGTQNEKKQLLMASGDYPAAFLNGNFTRSEQVKFGTEGILIPLNDLIEQYGSEIKRAFEEDPELKNAITAPDGNIYSLPAINECYQCWYSQKLWLNTKWVKDLGLEVPKTTEEFYQVLKAFKTQDPNGNGLDDEIPISSATDGWNGNLFFIMNAFIYTNSGNYLYMDNGQVKLSANQPEWKDGMAFINRLYSEGLIDPEIFTQNLDALRAATNREGDNVIGSVTGGFLGQYFDTLGERHKEYETLAPLTGPAGVAWTTFFKGYENGQFAITNKATEAQQIAAMQFANYMYTEEFAVQTQYGLEDVGYWRKGQEGETDEHGRPAKYTILDDYWNKNIINGPENETWAQLGIARRTRDIRESYTVPEDPLSDTGYDYRVALETAKNYDGKEPDELFPNYLFYDPEVANEMAQLQTQINDYIKNNFANFVTGNQPLNDDSWNAYVEGFNGLNLDRYLEIQQSAYDAWKSRSQ